MDTTVSFAPSDYTRLDQSPLADRWEALPERARASIRPLRAAVADRLRATAAELDERLGPDALEFPADVGTDAVREHLRALDIPAGTDVAVWWPWGAVIAPWGVLVVYWDDFCYAGADDVTVWPAGAPWALSFDHHERFRFGHLAPAR